MQWKVKETIPEAVRRELVIYPDLQQHLLWHRGIRTAKGADDFLHPAYERDLHDPFLIKNLEKAVDRILLAIEANEQIVIYGDYDCDGIPGTTALYGFFEKIGYTNVGVYIPHRHKEGYGLNVEALEKLASEGVRVVITVDSGIADHAPAARAKELGLDLIITDHHLIQGGVPEAWAVVNSKQDDDEYPFDQLCGAGVVFKLVQGLIKKGRGSQAPKMLAMFEKMPSGWEKWLLDMVGLATIADMVPLVGENRTLAHFGLRVLRKTSRPGLSRLFIKMRVKREHLGEDDVGFSIAPVINAASRLGTPMDAFNMLASLDPVLATTQADALVKLNTERKAMVREMVAEAHGMVAARISGAGGVEESRGSDIMRAEHLEKLPAVLVVGRPEWRAGLLGLAASALVDAYARPVFVWGREGSPEIKGSCRSDGTVNMVELMTAAGDVFSGMGGHAFAGGFSCADQHLGSLEATLLSAYRSLVVQPLKNGEIAGGLVADARLELDAIDWLLYEDVVALAPFGVGNEKPVFLIENVLVNGTKMFGKSGEHLRLSLQKNEKQSISAIRFFSKFKIPSTGSRVSLLCNLEKSTFGYRPELRLRIVDMLAC